MIRNVCLKETIVWRGFLLKRLLCLKSMMNEVPTVPNRALKELMGQIINILEGTWLKVEEWREKRNRQREGKEESLSRCKGGRVLF